jgi:hypothetical protein
MMPICSSRKLAFVHIPKTAGSSVTKLLGMDTKEHFFEVNYHAYEFEGVSYAPQHLTPRWLKELVPAFDSYTTFCFTRHPYAKAVSEYYWLRKEISQRKVRVFIEPLFRRWIRRELALMDMDHKLPQAHYVEGCQHVFRYEDLGVQWEAIAHVMGVDPKVQLPRVVVGRQNTSRIVTGLSAETRRMIQELYPNDFEALGYDR